MFVLSKQKFYSSSLRSVILCTAILCMTTAFITITSHSLYAKIPSTTLDNLAGASAQPQFSEESPASHASTDALQHELNLVGHTGGHINVMTIEGDYAYAGIGPYLVVLDITDRVQPMEISRSSPLQNGIIYDIEVHEDHVYVANGQGGLVVFDVSDRAAPHRAAILEETTQVRTLEVEMRDEKSYLYLIENLNFRVLDITEPTTSQELSVLALPETIRKIQLVDQHIYAFGEGAEFYLIDIADLTDVSFSPMREKYDIEVPPNLPMGFGNFVVLNKHVYANVWSIGKTGARLVQKIFDITEPSNPQLHSEIPLSSNIVRYMVTDSTFLYIIRQICGYDDYRVYICDWQLVKLDVSDPVQPVEIETSIYQNVSRSTVDMILHDNYAYLLRPETPMHIASLDDFSILYSDVSWSGHDLEIIHNQAYLLGIDTALYSLDIDDLSQPVLYSTSAISGTARDLAANGPYLYVGSGSPLSLEPNSRIAALDVSSSSNIQSLQPITTSQGGNIWAGFVDVEGGYAFIPSRSSSHPRARNHLFNILDTSNPIFLGNVGDANQYSTSAKVQDRYFYVYAYAGNLNVWDIVDPENPVNTHTLYFEISHTRNDSIKASMIALENTVWLSDGSRLMRFNTSDPLNPSEVASLYSPGVITGIFVDGHYIYVADRSGLLRVINAANESSLFEVARLETPSALQGIEVKDGVIYLANGTGGFYTLRHEITPGNERNYLPIIANPPSATSVEGNILYQAHVQEVGWMDWVGEEQTAGEVGNDKRIEAVRIKIADSPSSTTMAGIGITYQAHVQDVGWQNWVYDGEIAGTINRHKRMEAIRMRLLDAPEGTTIRYRVYLEGGFWQEWVDEGGIAGTVSESLRIEGLEIQLVQN